MRLSTLVAATRSPSEVGVRGSACLDLGLRQVDAKYSKDVQTEQGKEEAIMCQCASRPAGQRVKFGVSRRKG